MKSKPLQRSDHQRSHGAAKSPDDFGQDDFSLSSLMNILDRRELQSLLDDFRVLTGIGVAIADLKGKLIMVTKGQDICVHFHRAHPQTVSNCIESTTFQTRNVKPGEYLLYKCKNHMWDVVTPLVIGNVRVGNLFLGQFFFDDEELDRKLFIRQAEACGFDQKAYMDALDRVPRMSRAKINTAMDYSVRLASMLSRMIHANLELQQALEDQKQTKQAVTFQLDLGLALDHSSTLQETLQLCLKAAMAVSGLDVGGIYMADRSTGQLTLSVAAGASETFIASAAAAPADSERTQLVMAGKQIILNESDIMALGQEDLLKEKIRSVIIIPISHQGRVIGCLNLASHVYDEIPLGSHYILENVVRQIGQSILRIQDEEALRKSEEKYRVLVESANSLILRIDRSGTVTFCNRYAQHFFGFSEDDIIGKNAVGTIVPETDSLGRDLSVMIQSICLNPDQYVNNENENIKRNGERVWITWTNRPLYDEKGNVVELLCVGNDITNLKRAEQEKKILEDQLRQAQKMEAIGTMAGGIAHDFNNILASVMGYTELASKEPYDERQRKFLEQVLKAAERAKNLVGQILAFSRQTEQSRQALDIRSIVKESIKLLRATIPSTIQIRHNISTEECAVLSDPTQMHQIVINLCNNAAHAMRDQGGMLDVGLSNVRILREMVIIHPDIKEGAYVLLTIRDTGHGIDPTIKDKIFDPFFTTKKPQEGTGLGLSVVYGIVKSHGGAITVQSDLGAGTTFSIYLPKIELNNTAQEMGKTASLTGGKERVLFIDDEKALTELVPVFLRNLGYDVVSTTNSINALTMFTQDPQRFDLVITDMTMPQMTGLELSEKVLALRENLPIILCTGYHESITRNEVLRRGIRELVMKPVSLTDLGLLVRKTLDEGIEG